MPDQIGYSVPSLRSIGMVLLLGLYISGLSVGYFVASAIKIAGGSLLLVAFVVVTFAVRLSEIRNRTIPSGR